MGSCIQLYYSPLFVYYVLFVPCFFFTSLVRSFAFWFGFHFILLVLQSLVIQMFHGGCQFWRWISFCEFLSEHVGAKKWCELNLNKRQPGKLWCTCNANVLELGCMYRGWPKRFTICDYELLILSLEISSMQTSQIQV